MIYYMDAISFFSCLLIRFSQAKFFLIVKCNFSKGLKICYNPSSSNLNSISIYLYKNIIIFHKLAIIFLRYESSPFIFLNKHYYDYAWIRIYVKSIIKQMKKIRSPLKQTLNNLLQLSDRPIKQEQQKISKQFPSILNKTHDQQHRRNTNSIKKVLKELQDLKKDLNDLKINKKIESIPEQLDNSKCRKMKAQTKRSSPSPQAPHSHSSSRNKTLSNQKETSTQTKRMMKKQNKNNDFSFTAHQQNNRSPKQFNHSEQDEDSNEYNPFTLRSPNEQRSIQQSSRNKQQHTQSRNNLKKSKVFEQIQSIQTAQTYERYLTTLKNSFSMLQISSSAFTGEQKLKINIQMQRMSNQIRRIPMYIKQPIQFYENMTMYARNLNNQLNNLAIIMNRCEGRHQKLRERHYYENIMNKEASNCKNCQENQKKDWQRFHKRQIKRIQKQVNKLQSELQQAKEQINLLTTQNLILLKERDDFTFRYTTLERKLSDEQKKVKILSDVKEEMERQMKELDSKRFKEIQRNKLQEQDLNYYKNEIERFKKNVYAFKQDRNASLQDKERKQQENQIIQQLKQKELLYQSIIRDKETQISDLKKKINDLFDQLNQQLTHQRQRKSHKNDDRNDQPTESTQLHKLKIELQQKNRFISSNYREIEVWKLRADKLQQKNKQLENLLEQCSAQIKKLHSQIDALEQVNENYKQKYLKNKIKNESKSKRQVQVKNRKDTAFHELNQLIRNHRNNIENEASIK